MLKHRALIIGYGVMGKVHTKNLLKLGIDVAGVIDIDENALVDAKKLGNIIIASDINDYLQQCQDINTEPASIVAITANTKPHFKIIKQLIDSGYIPNKLFIEKPITDTYEESIKLSEQLKQLSRDKPIDIAVGYLVRTSPAVSKLIDILQDSPYKNDTFEVNIKWQKQRNNTRPSAGVIRDETTHSIDLIRYILSSLGRAVLEPENIKVNSALVSEKIIDKKKQLELYKEDYLEARVQQPFAEVAYELYYPDVAIKGSSSFVNSDYKREISLQSDNFIAVLNFDCRQTKQDSLTITLDGITKKYYFPSSNKILDEWQDLIFNPASSRIASVTDAVVDCYIVKALEDLAELKLEENLLSNNESSLNFMFTGSKQCNDNRLIAGVKLV